MVCDECNIKEATFHSLKIINGIKSEKHLCPSCQSKQASRVSAAKNLAQIFSSFNAISGAGGANVSIPKRELKSCKNCGIGITEVLKEGFLGCPDCYETFLEVLLPMIAKVQNGTAHKGKSPYAAKKKSSAELEIEHLKQEIKLAALEERYEDAAALQAKIKSLLEGGSK